MAKSKTDKTTTAAPPAVIEAENLQPKAELVHQAPALPTPAPPPLARATMATLSDADIALVKNTVGLGLTDMEFKWGMYVSQRLNLDPLRKQVHFIKRRKRKKDSQDWEEFLTIQVSIDGARAIANRTRCYAPSERLPQFNYREDEKTHKPVLFSATVWVKKFTAIDGSWHEYGATVVFDEFVPLERDGNSWKISSMWEKMPHNQLEKCAEFKALKRGFPEELGELNIEEEFQRLDAEAARAGNGGGESAQVPTSQSRKERERGALRTSREENRGHDREGYVEGQGAPRADAVKPAASKKDAKPTEQLAVKVTEVKPLMKKLTTDQIKENKALKDKNQQPKFEPQPYYLLKCEGDIDISVWDKHIFRAAVFSKGKKCTFEVTRNGKYINMGGVVDIAGQKFAVDPETKDWIPEATLKATQMPQQQPSQAAQPSATTQEPPAPQSTQRFPMTGDVVGFQDAHKDGRPLETREHKPMVAITLLDKEEDHRHDPHATFVCILPELFSALKLAEGERCSFSYTKFVDPSRTLWQMIQEVHQVGDQKFKEGKPQADEPIQPLDSSAATGSLWGE
jgi:phage recombination protein Bet